MCDGKACAWGAHIKPSRCSVMEAILDECELEEVDQNHPMTFCYNQHSFFIIHFHDNKKLLYRPPKRSVIPILYEPYSRYKHLSAFIGIIIHIPVSYHLFLEAVSNTLYIPRGKHHLHMLATARSHPEMSSIFTYQLVITFQRLSFFLSFYFQTSQRLFQITIFTHSRIHMG